MADQPRFPSPGEAKRKDVHSKITPSEPRAPIVVKRAEPIPESTAPKKNGPKAKLTPDEVRALLAVSEANRPNKLWRRGRVIAIPTVLLSITANLFMSYWPIVVAALVIAAIVWTVGPWKKPEDEWGG